MSAMQTLEVIARCPEGNGTPALPKDVVSALNAFRGLLDIAERIHRANASGNNGAVMGEAILCNHFAWQLRAAIAEVKGEPA